jgi:VIT1/CCC1 family predicted Fe2+/Mn2+ transporter
MRLSLLKGFAFGLTSGIITTLGLIVGLHSTTHDALVVIGGIIIIAVADAMSDSLGMHISQESENTHTRKEVWESTIGTFLAKFIFALTFIIPMLLFSLNTAIIVSVIWGLSWIALVSFYLARKNGERPLHVIGEHLAIASVVVVITHYLGDLIRSYA